MNKLYVIRFYTDRGVYTNGIGRMQLDTNTFWDAQEAENKIIELINIGWTVKLTENNDIHKIWEAF